MQDNKITITYSDVKCYLNDLWENQRCICDDLHGTEWPFELITKAGYGYLLDEFIEKFKDNIKKQSKK